MYTYCDKQIITGITNSSNPGKVEMYSHSSQISFVLLASHLQMAMAFYPFLHPHTDSPEEKLNLVVNKAILI